MSKKDEPVHVISCGACVYRRVGKSVQVLLVKPTWSCPSWGIPKGHINEGESVEDCARREVLEEVGVEVTLEAPLLVVQTAGKGEVKDVHAWLAQQVDVNERPFPADKENVAAQWFDIDELPRIHKYQVPMFEHALRLLKRLKEGVDEMHG
jgi:ADP-ribose pyrophosphatase YjhB (NUDIX family)